MINIALPKGSLEEQTLRLFKEADLEVRRTDRDYNPQINDKRIGKGQNIATSGDTNIY